MSRFSPRRRRWQTFLRSFELDPRSLGSNIEPPGERDFLIAGSPRSGSTLLSAVLYQPPGVVTFMEPWDGMRFLPARLFTTLRDEIATGTIRRSKLDLPELMRSGNIVWSAEGATPVSVEADPDCLVGVKWPAFWQYIGLLPTTKFLLTVRHPFETISSYKRKGGALGTGLDYDIAFNRAINEELGRAAPDDELRRVLLYERINREVVTAAQRDNVLLVRYERWFEDPDQLLKEIEAFLGAKLSANHVKIRRPPDPPRLTETELELIREHCRSARELGYDLDLPASRH